MKHAALTGLLATLLCLALLGCANRQAVTPLLADEAPAVVRQVAGGLTPAEQGLSSWNDLAPAIDASLDYVRSKAPEDIAVTQDDVAVTWAEVARALNRLRALLPRLDANPGLLAEQFRWLRLNEGAHFSGYYEAEVKASRKPSEIYCHPLYRRPPDLHTVVLGDFTPELIGMRLVYRIHESGGIVPYYSRSEIEEGVLKGQELAWVTSALDAYFLQIQGSGRLRFEDGTVLSALYDGDNGRPYRSLGRRMVDEGLIPAEEISMQSIRAWLGAHPDRQDEMLNYNPRYVFFRLRDEQLVGSIGRPLTPYVTLAVDRTTFPLGGALVYRTSLPQQAADGSRAQPRPITGIGLAQDTGGAIKYRRIDLFCGSGDRAAYEAGHLNVAGDVWLLLAR